MAAVVALSSLGITAAYPAAPVTVPSPVAQDASEYAPDGTGWYSSEPAPDDTQLAPSEYAVDGSSQHPANSNAITSDTGVDTFVSLTADGLSSYFCTTARTVGDMLSRRGVQLSSSDRISLDLDTPLSDGIAVIIQRVTTTTDERTESTGWSSYERYTTDLAPGEWRVVVDGVAGEVVVKTVTVWVDGKIESQEDFTEVLSEPVNELVEVGVGSGGSAQIAAFNQLREWGWGDDQFVCLVDLWQRESNWDATAENPDSGAYGIPQAYPAERMASFGDDWAWNAETQIAWGLDYIADRYGSPCAAWWFWVDNNWY
ncbi:MAG: G5 domain-containing protein [Propionibacteriaceae bacterium]|jgi:hypothetical protein|nr:G5 domain-containing protein [Propionibacteriaceae bacterium]